MISSQTIRAKKDFDLLYRKGASANGKFFYLKYLAAKNTQDPTRFAIVIGTKVSKKATDRNRKKRQLREIIRLNGERIKSGFMVIALAKDNILEAGYEELEKELLFLCKKSNLLN